MSAGVSQTVRDYRVHSGLEAEQIADEGVACDDVHGSRLCFVGHETPEHDDQEEKDADHFGDASDE